MKENLAKVSQFELQNLKLIEEKIQISSQNLQKDKLIS